MIIQHNLQAMNASRQFGIITGKKAKSTEKLSSGYKINRAADDAAGLAISEKMRRQIRGLTQASENCQDGISFAQTADGYLHEVHDMLQRVNELSVKAANGTLNDVDRSYVDSEVQALKEEMSRIFKTASFNEIPIFHVPYTPEIQGIPNDMQLFHTGNGQIGGLEFNNVRYSISELQDKGLKIDDNGVATRDFEASFKLWDGETVDLSMKKGQELGKVERDYKWTADENGIYINKKLSVEWSEIEHDGIKGISDTSHFPAGTYSFSHHGMTISFELDSNSAIEDLMNGINGDEATKPAHWGIGVGGARQVTPADINDENSKNTIRVSEANKNYIDRDFFVVANENGIAIRSVDKNDPSISDTTSYVSWSSFKDSSLSSIVDENGNPVETNGGYPIQNWGEGDDGNGKNEITFDGDATYHFTSPDENVKIEFDFKLSDTASLSEVMSSLNGAQIYTPDVNAPGQMYASGSGTYGSITVGSVRPLSDSFDLQRAYGRNFDNKNATLTATITVKRSTIDGQPSDEQTVGPNGDYSTENGHNLIMGIETWTLKDTVNEPDVGEEQYKYYSETVEVKDALGNTVYETDENGDPTDVPQTETKYYKCVDMRKIDTYDVSWRTQDYWQQRVKYTYDGTLNGHDMENISRDQTENYYRNLDQTQVRSRWTVTASVQEIAEGEVPTGATMMSSSDFEEYKNKADNRTVIRTETHSLSDISTTTGETILTGIVNRSFSNLAFNSSEDLVEDRIPFYFNAGVALSQALELTKTSDAVTVGTVTFRASDYATRDFTPNEKSGTVPEDMFNDITLYVPEKSLDIQAGAEAGQHIHMEWSPLNLTIIGMSNANTLTAEDAEASIDMVKKALRVISQTRSDFGAYQNRMEHTINNLDNVVENTQAAESEIRDTDMAKEMVAFSTTDIIQQAGQAMMANANQTQQGILSLL